MTAPLQLLKYEYSMQPAAVASVLGNKHIYINQTLPVIHVKIDFENGKMLLEGDWQYMVKSNKHNYPVLMDLYAERVQMDLKLYTDAEITKTTGSDTLFHLEGVLKNSTTTTYLSGLLILETHPSSTIKHHLQQSVTFYIYVSGIDFCEIRFRFPLFINTTINEFNN